MGVFDKRREQLGISTAKSSAQPSSGGTGGGSAFERRRASIEQERESRRQESIKQAEARKAESKKKESALPSIRQQLETATTSFTPQSKNRALRPTQGPPAPTGRQQRANINAQLPGRDIPVVGPVLKTFDKLQEFTEPAAKVAEQLYTPAMGATAMTAGAKFLGTGLSKLSPTLGLSEKALPTVGRKAIEGAVLGAAEGGGHSLASNPKGGLTEAGKQALYGAGLGVGGAGLVGGAKGLNQVLKNAAERVTGGKLGAVNAIEQVGRQGDQVTAAAKQLADIDEQLTTLNSRSDKGASYNDEVQSLINDRNQTIDFIRRNDPDFAAPDAPVIGSAAEVPTVASTKTPTQPVAASVNQPEITKNATPSTDPNVLKFANTVRDSKQTPKELSDLIADNPPTGLRTTDKLNHVQATKLIKDNGIEGTASRLLAKRNRLTPPEMTAAQMLAKHYSNLGGDENLQKSIEIISKTAREGRELGQAMQALSMWNKLDQEGALLLAERQLNRGVTDTAEWTKLTVAQAKPVQEAAKKIEEVQEARTLADQIVKMLADKPQGTALTDAEKALIKQFEQQVKRVNETVKPFIKKAQSEHEKIIKEVSNIKPKDRTRDQVVSFLDAKAAKAQERIRRSRNIGFAAMDQGNIVVDLSIIGAAKVAKGVVRAADFSEQMIKEFGDHLKPYMNEAFVKATNIFRRENGIPSDAELNRVVTAAIKQNKLDDATANSLRAMATEIGFYLDSNLKKEAIQDLQLSMKSLGTSTLGEKTATLQTAAQLLSVPTFLRNAFGNMGQIGLEKINKMSAVPIDWAVSKLTGERTIKFFSNNQEKFWRNFAEGTVSGWRGVSPTGTLSSYDIHPNVFGEKNPLSYLTKTLGASLQGMDYAAYRSAYGDVVATYAEQLGNAQKLTRQQIKQQMPQLIKQLDQRILDMADQAGLYATYQDETMLSAAAQSLKRGLNSITDKPMRAMVDKGVLPKWASTEGFGLGDIVLKYARTPANLVMRGIDYSPLGFMRGVYELAPLFINRGKFDQAKATKALSRAITGTVGLTGLGYALADVGVLSGASSSDADMRSIQEQSGQGAYKVNWSALGRYLTSGLDKDAAKHQKGDMMMDYAWAQPAAISLGMGVNANQIIKNQKPGEEKEGFELAFQSVIGGLRTVLENPMVSGLSNVVDATTSLVKRNSSDGFANIIKGVPASFVPAVVGQARTSTDNLQRETFDENVFKSMMNLVKNKVPGLSKTLPVSHDSLGNKRERIQGGEANTLGQYLNSFINPTKLTTYSASPEAKLVLDVLNDSQDPTVLPRIGQKYMMVDDPITKENKRINLTKEQFSRLQQRMGEMVAEELRKNERYLSNSNHNVDDRVDKMKDILTKVGSKARNEIRVGMGYAEKK